MNLLQFFLKVRIDQSLFMSENILKRKKNDIWTKLLGDNVNNDYCKHDKEMRREKVRGEKGKVGQLG